MLVDAAFVCSAASAEDHLPELHSSNAFVFRGSDLCCMSPAEALQDSCAGVWFRIRMACTKGSILGYCPHRSCSSGNPRLVTSTLQTQTMSQVEKHIPWA